MCGIAGILSLDGGERVSKDLVQKMCSTIVHRGPDDEGIYMEGPIGIGMRRLSIIDLSGGHQPISNEDDSVWIVFNGEVFNHEELRKDLLASGHRFKTRSDTETILHLYEEKGTQCVELLRGMFAFAIWDARQRHLFLARDRLGIKPLFYRQTQESLSFGSEIKAILALPDARRQPNWTAIDAFFAYGYIPAPLTAFKGISKLLPGHFLLAGLDGVEVRQYWDLPFLPKHKASREELAEELLRLFRESVRMRLMSEVPLGAFLSGGVDSSLVVAMMSELLDQPTKTFTIGFGGEKGNFLDERSYAREVSARYGTDHEEFEVLPEVQEVLDACTRAFDEPFADDSVIPTYHICKLARAKVTVALTGLGGDENFAGYERYLGFSLSSRFESLPAILRNRVIIPMVNRLREEKGGHYRINHLKRFVRAAGLLPAQRYQQYLSVFTAEQRRALFLPSMDWEIEREKVEHLGHDHFDKAETDDDRDRALYQDIKTYLPEDILALTDRLSMHHSLELRVPFIDHKLVEFCARIPFGFKIRHGRKKYLLKKAAARYLPRSVISHRKQGFASPMAMWLRTGLRPYVREVLDPTRIESAGVLAPDYVAEVLRSHDERRSLNDRQIFSLLMFQKWFDKFF